MNHKHDFVCGRWDDVRVENGKLKGRLVLASQGSSSRIDEVRALVAAKSLTACSVGFRPIRSRPRAGGGVEYLAQELLECSLVAVGCNSNALLEARRLGVSNEVIKMVFKQSQRSPQDNSLSGRIARSRDAVRRAKAVLRKPSSGSKKPLLIGVAAETKARVERSRVATAKARAILAKIQSFIVIQTKTTRASELSRARYRRDLERHTDPNSRRMG